MIEKIISGGQSGVDRAALDAAIKNNISHGGWCPKGRLCEDGVINAKYHLQETDTSNYTERTKLNIRDSDATLVFKSSHEIKDGILLTIQQLEYNKKPFRVVNVSEEINFNELLIFFLAHKPRILNIAGPRESNSPGIYQAVYECMDKICVFLKYV